MADLSSAVWSMRTASIYQGALALAAAGKQLSQSLIYISTFFSVFERFVILAPLVYLA